MKQRFMVHHCDEILVSLLWEDGVLTIEEATDNLRSFAVRHMKHGEIQRVKWGVEVINDENRFYRGRRIPATSPRMFKVMVRQLSDEFPTFQFTSFDVE